MPDTDPKFITRAEVNFSIQELDPQLLVSELKYGKDGEVIGHLSAEEFEQEFKRRKGQGLFRVTATLYGKKCC